ARRVELQTQAGAEGFFVKCDRSGAVADDQIRGQPRIAVRDGFYCRHCRLHAWPANVGPDPRRKAIAVLAGVLGRRSVAVPQGSIADNARLLTLTLRRGRLYLTREGDMPEGAKGMRGRTSKGNVFVGNLPPDFADERLAETFDPYGIVLSAVVARDPDTGARLRYGFVDIATEKAAIQAIGALDGSAVDGCKLNVKLSERKTGGKKPGDGHPRGQAGARDQSGPRRPPFRAGAPRRTPIGAAEMPPRRPAISAADMPERPERPERPSPSSGIAAELSEMEPPPRRDFEVAYKPARRKTTPNFQVERRSLPRRS